MLLGVFLPGCTWNHVYDSPVEGCPGINSAVCIGHEACVSEFGTNVSCRGRCWLKGGLKAALCCSGKRAGTEGACPPSPKWT